MSGRWVDVAVDAAGIRGGQTFTYHVPASLGSVTLGEAVLVEYGSRQAVGIVVGDAAEEPSRGTKPVLARVRSDGPLLPELSVRLAGHISRHYLAPPGMVVRAMLPPGLLERVELVARAREEGGGTHADAPPETGEAPATAAPPETGDATGEALETPAPPSSPGAASRRGASRPAFGDPLPPPPVGHDPAHVTGNVSRRAAHSAETAELLGVIRAAGDAGIAVEDLPVAASRATLLRRLRELEASGAIDLAWQVRPSEVQPRLERRARLTPAGRRAAEALARGETLDGRPLGPCQRALLAEMAGTAQPSNAALQPARAGDHEPSAREPSAPAGGDEPVAFEPAARLADRHGTSAVTSLARRGFLELQTQVRPRRPLAGRREPARGTLPAGAELTPDQSSIVERVAELIRARRFEGLLVEGVAASGKTAVYAAAVSASLSAGRPALILVPEIALAVPLIDRLRHDLGVDVALLHSALGEGERSDEWRRIRAGEAQVVVGTRMAALAPLSDVGVIVVDEEHDPAYKSDRTPRYQARDVALELGRLAGAPVILGSATPDVVSVGRARMGSLTHVRLADRAAGVRASVEIVDLREELASGNRGLLSDRLVAALQGLDRSSGDQAILVMNRRGSASVVICRDCGYVQVCPECQRPLVFHAAAMALRCHHCGAAAPPARRCPACGSPRIRYLGGGTERVEREVRLRMPELRVERLDRDVVEKRGEAARIVDAFADGTIDVLVGTSLVTKGLDVPGVTLVGVVSADISLNLPDDRAAERTWQLLEQAVGRAGRGERAGRAIIQTYVPEHPAIVAVADGDARAFVDDQLALRQAFGAAPFGGVIKLTAALEDRETAETVAAAMAAKLRDRAAASGSRVAVLGPVPAYVARRAGRWRFHVVLRGEDPLGVLGEDPGPPWSVDVDPESLL